ncbi:hypothetical protein [uncultured phage MedDCM-OCT-S05-C22]|nr:hypothetical protein [uncultured phage MedDCM-OCT-S05-C22]
MENCAATCPVVTEAVQASSREVRINMALVAIEAEKISESEAARKFKIPRKTLSNRRRSAEAAGHLATTITPEERQKWHQDKADGMAIAQIARKYGRDRGAVRKELKKDLPVVVPAIKPEGMACEIVAREKRAISRQLKGLEGLVLLERELHKSWKADQKRWEKAGRSVWQNNVQEAHDVISSNGCLAKHREILGLSEQASYLEVLDVLEARAKSAMDSIQWLKYLSGYTDLPGGASKVN